MEKLTIDLDFSSVTATTEAFDRLRLAIEAVNIELDKLAGKRHGGIRISAVGSVIHCEVKPAA